MEMVEFLTLEINQIIVWILYFLSSIILISVFLNKARLSVKSIIGHVLIAGIAIGLYSVMARNDEKFIYLLVVLCFVLLHMLYKMRLWEFCVTQCVYFIIFTLGLVVFDYIGEKLNLSFLKLASVSALWALGMSIVVVKLFKGTFLYYKDKIIYDKLSWYQGLFYSIVSVAVVLTANVGVIIYREGMTFRGGDVKLALIAYIALVGIIICYLENRKVVIRECEKKEEELIKSFSAKQLEAYRRLERLEEEGKLVEEEMGEQVAALMGLVEEEQIAYVKPYVESIQNQLLTEHNYILTGNTVVDTIINEKYKVACEKHIFISINISLPEELGIDIGDLCLIIGNGIDYALEACEKLTLGKGRKIKIRGVWYKGYIIFKIWYSRAKNTEIEEKLSSEEETRLAIQNDIYGLGAVKKYLEKYDGKLEFYTEGKWHKLEFCFNTVNG